jgi:pimeloyl-ACP methyl ester carboxylesterase
MLFWLRVTLLAATTFYQAIAVWLEDRTPPPGQLFDVGGYRLHLYTLGDRKPTYSQSIHPQPIHPQPTIVLDHSLGGLEGYLLIERLAKLGQVCICDRAGYGWSEQSPHPRTSQQIVSELDQVLTQAGIEPPYLLMGDSFGSYNMRLYAAQFPEKVSGLVLTDGLHEQGMLNLPPQLWALKMFFISGFLVSVLGSFLGIVRLFKDWGTFEILKPELRGFSQFSVNSIKRSFCRPKHWITMTRELWSLDWSGRQMTGQALERSLPIISIKSNSFFQPALWTLLIPLADANRLRDQMHLELLQLSSNCSQIQASQSGHFVWVDQPDILIDAVKQMLANIDRQSVSGEP